MDIHLILFSIGFFMMATTIIVVKRRQFGCCCCGQLLVLSVDPEIKLERLFDDGYRRSVEEIVLCLIVCSTIFNVNYSDNQEPTTTTTTTTESKFLFSERQ